VHQIEVDMVEPEFFQGSIERPAERIRRQIFVPDFCGDMQVFAGNARGCNRGTHGLLIVIHLGGVEMPVAQRQPALHGRAAGIALHAKGAETKLRQADTLGLQMFHDGSPGKEKASRA
jgi:hypothetical protein